MISDDDPPATLEEKLVALANRESAPSKAALIRRHLPQIEAAQAGGATNAEIVDAFRSSGVEMSLSTFESTLSRARRKQHATPAGKKAANRRTDAEGGSRKKEGAAGTPQGVTRSGLQMPEEPAKFHWDPLERPKITFTDDDEEKED